MTESPLYAITITRDFGCGGAYLGQRLAARFGFLYADRDILQRAAKELGEEEDVLAMRDERLLSFWEALMEDIAAGAGSLLYSPPPLHIPSDMELFRIESDIIRRLAQQQSVIIVGHAGCQILREHPRHASIFLHAGLEFRLRRIQEVYHVTAREAREMLDSRDKTRARYVRTMTGCEPIDVRNYQLGLNVGVTGVEAAEGVLVTFLQARFPEATLFHAL